MACPSYIFFIFKHLPLYIVNGITHNMTHVKNKNIIKSELDR